MSSERDQAIVILMGMLAQQRGHNPAAQANLALINVRLGIRTRR